MAACEWVGRTDLCPSTAHTPPELFHSQCCVALLSRVAALCGSAAMCDVAVGGVVLVSWHQAACAVMGCLSWAASLAFFAGYGALLVVGWFQHLFDVCETFLTTMYFTMY